MASLIKAVVCRMCPDFSFAMYACAIFLNSLSTSGISFDRAWESPLLQACSSSVISCVRFMAEDHTQEGFVWPPSYPNPDFSVQPLCSLYLCGYCFCGYLATTETQKILSYKVM